MHKSLGLEEVVRMPPLSMRSIELLGEAVLGEIEPEALEHPMRVDLCHWVDNVLPKRGIHVAPASSDKLVEVDAEAVTIPDGNSGSPIEILVDENVFAALELEGPASHRARATVAHELSHAIIHVPVIRRRRESPVASLLLKRVKRERIPSYQDPEWQAWALAGSILMPRRTLKHLGSYDASHVAAIYGVSQAMARLHLRRLKM